MNTHADKKRETKSRAAANSLTKQESNGKATFQFVDNRPEAIAQRKLQEMANYYLSNKQQAIPKNVNTIQLKNDVIQMNPKQVAEWATTNDFFTPDFGGGRVVEGNDVFIPTAHIYPHIHIGKDFVVLSKNRNNHVELMRGDQVFKARIQNNLNGYMSDINQVLRYMDSQF